MSVRGSGWTVDAVARRRGPALPFLPPPIVPLVQTGPDGRARAARASFRGRGHLARVTVEVGADGDLAAWLPAGRRTGLLCPDLRGHLTVATTRG